MPVLKVKKDGVWEDLGGTSPINGGNADTLDGQHASYFATASDVDDLLSKVGDTSVSEQINIAVENKADVSHTHSEYSPMYSYGTDDLTAGTSELETGKLYFVYE